MRTLRVLLAGFVLTLGVFVASPVAPTQALVLNLIGLSQMDAGTTATCATFGSGAVTCWGNGSNQGLGNGSSVNRSVPTAVPGITTATKVAVGNSFACALLSGGSVQCWGDNTLGQLGDGTFGHPTLPVTVAGISTAVDVDAGSGHACAALADGNMKCWGANGFGQLGIAPSVENHPTPVTVAGVTGVVQVATGGSHTCMRRNDNTMRCWGANTSGQVGNGTVTGTVTTPTAPTGIFQGIDITAGAAFTCVVTNMANVKEVYCWGNNTSKQLGNNADSVVPQKVTTALTDPVHVTAGWDTACVTTAALDVYCWGNNDNRQLGNNSAVAESAVAVQVAPLSDAADIAVGAYWACALLDSTGIACWGNGYGGVLGVGTDSSHGVPGTLPLPPGEYVPLTPARILDTRPSGVTVDGTSQKLGVVAAGGTLTVPVRNRAGVPNSAVSVVLNLTAVGAAGNGNVVVWPCDQPKPTASNLNVQVGPARANLVVAKVTTTGPQIGAVCASPSVNTDLIMDVQGYYKPSGAFTALTPARLYDTRPNGSTIDGQGREGGTLSPGITRSLTLAGRGSLAADAVAATLNLTAVNPSGNGNVTVWSCEGTQPTVANLNFRAGVTTANLAITNLSPSGGICMASSVDTYVLIDVVGGFAPTTLYQRPAPPYRLSDSRPSGTTFDDTSKAYGPVAAGSTTKIEVATRTAATTSVARTVVLNVAGVGAEANGYITAWPCGKTRPAASNLNVPAGGTASNTAVVEVGDDNSVCIYTSTKANLVVDLFGYYFS